MLYKLDANNQVREWAARVEQVVDGWIVLVHHGSLVGQKVVEKSHTFTSETLALCDMQRRYDYMKQRRGYSATIPTSRPIRPMLAKTYEPGKTFLPSKIAVQPKLNGVRCLASKNFMKSRTNTYFTSCPQIQLALSSLPEDILLDGELYCHGATFQEISSWTGTDGENPNSHKISYHVFDVAEESLPFVARIALLEELVQTFNNARIKLVPTTVILSTTLDSHQSLNLSNGYEGTMIRLLDKNYELNVRSFSLYKYKPVSTAWYLITDIIPGKSGRGKKEGLVRCKTANGLYFNVALAMPTGVRRQILDDKAQFIGKSALIEYRDKTDDEIPSHAVVKEIR